MALVRSQVRCGFTRAIFMTNEEINIINPIETYPKGVRGKVEQIFNKAQLPLVGSGRDGSVPKAREYSVGITGSPYPNSLDTEAAAFNVRFPQALDGLLVQSGETAEKYVARNWRS